MGSDLNKVKKRTMQTLHILTLERSVSVKALKEVGGTVTGSVWLEGHR